MSNEGFKGVPGVPEGWELVHASRSGQPGEHGIDANGMPIKFEHETLFAFPIIRKIEVPKKYRPFANGAEYMASPRRGVAVDWKTVGTDGFYAVVSANARFVWVAFGDKIEHFTWNQAFEKLVCRHADGSKSPFGVEVKDE
jgi:hypothetical protein